MSLSPSSGYLMNMLPEGNKPVLSKVKFDHGASLSRMCYTDTIHPVLAPRLTS
jgi:hypothetical protein